MDVQLFIMRLLVKMVRRKRVQTHTRKGTTHVSKMSTFAVRVRETYETSATVNFTDYDLGVLAELENKLNENSDSVLMCNQIICTYLDMYEFNINMRKAIKNSHHPARKLARTFAYWL
jgi:hypothetical protein